MGFSFLFSSFLFFSFLFFSFLFFSFLFLLSMKKFLNLSGLIIGGFTGVGIILNETNKFQQRNKLLMAFAEEKKEKEKLVVLGCGWAATGILKTLDTNRYDVYVVSPRNYFLFTPLLPSATVGTVENRSLVESIHAISYKRFRENPLTFYEARCEEVDFKNKKIICNDDSGVSAGTFEVDYDKLVIAIGSTNNTFGIENVEKYCCFLKVTKKITSVSE